MLKNHITDLNTFLTETLYKNNVEGLTVASYKFSISKLNFRNILELLQNSNHKFFYWSQPHLDISYIAINSVFDISLDSTERLYESQTILDSVNISSNYLQSKDDIVPTFFGGIKFAPEAGLAPWQDYTDSDWFIPEMLLINNNHTFYVVFNFTKKNYKKHLQIVNNYNSLLNESQNINIKVYPTPKTRLNGSDKSDWIKLVNTGLQDITKGFCRKIVLSRSVKTTSKIEYSLSEWLSTLSKRYPKCFVFAYRKGNSVFFGATPEKLAVINDNKIEADALAGSVPRGNTPEEDKKIVEEQLLDDKNCSEHRAVVDFIIDSFKDFATDIKYDKDPIVRQLPNIQHLWTPIEGKLIDGNKIFLMLKALHPTPAICGTPWREALKRIIELEPHNRGLFTGAIGWFNKYNFGQFAVAIRSGLIKDNTLYGYAGCGIVEGSNPEIEYDETILKLKPILGLLDVQED